MSNWVITKEKYLDSDEVKQLRKTIESAMLLAKSKGHQLDVRDFTIIELALGTGLRVSEISNLKLNDLALGKGQNSLIVRHGKGDKQRQVQFSSRLKKIIVDYLEYRNSDSEYLFYSKRQKFMTSTALQKVVKKWFKRTGLPDHYSIHSLRHTYITRLYISSNSNLRLCQQMAGHSSPNVTAVYAHVLSKDLRDAVELMDKD